MAGSHEINQRIYYTEHYSTSLSLSLSLSRRVTLSLTYTHSLSVWVSLSLCLSVSLSSASLCRRPRSDKVIPSTQPSSAQQPTTGERTRTEPRRIPSAPAVHNKLLQLIIKAADKNKIPYQLSASSRSTGTDTDAFAYSNGGVPSALISLPLRYMHTTVEMAAKEDIENVTNLIYQSLLSIKNNHNFKYF